VRRALLALTPPPDPKTQMKLSCAPSTITLVTGTGAARAYAGPVSRAYVHAKGASRPASLQMLA